MTYSDLSAEMERYRAWLRVTFGPTPQERETERVADQKELGKQHTPFRPGRRRTRFVVGGPLRAPETTREFWRCTRFERITWKRLGLEPM